MFRAIAILWCVFVVTPSLGQPVSALQEILTTGELKVGVTGDWDPMSVKDPAIGSYKGFDVDVMVALAEDLGVAPVFVPTDWKTLVNGIVAGKYHITGSASLSPQRAKAAGYSSSYFALSTVPLVRKGDVEAYQSWEDINQAMVTVAVTLGTVQELYAREFFPRAQLRVIEAPARDYQEVLAGRADVHITSNVEAAKLVEKYDQLAIVPVREGGRKATPVAMLLPQSDQIWINYVNHWIALRKARGFFAQLERKWGLQKP